MSHVTVSCELIKAVVIKLVTMLKMIDMKAIKLEGREAAARRERRLQVFHLTKNISENITKVFFSDTSRYGSDISHCLGTD